MFARLPNEWCCSDGFLCALICLGLRVQRRQRVSNAEDGTDYVATEKRMDNEMEDEMETGFSSGFLGIM